jgi:glycopeptide antibiotics resistance protein
VDDLIFNTLGAALGAFLFILVRQKNLFPSGS